MRGGDKSRQIEPDAYYKAVDGANARIWAHSANFDKAILAVSGGTLGLLANVLLALPPSRAIHYIVLLLFGTASLLLAGCAVLLGWFAATYRDALKAWRLGRQAEGLEAPDKEFKELIEAETPCAALAVLFRQNTWLPMLNILSFILMIVGLGSVAVFAILNLNRG
jgi:hypothetical protein